MFYTQYKKYDMALGTSLCLHTPLFKRLESVRVYKNDFERRHAYHS